MVWVVQYSETIFRFCGLFTSCRLSVPGVFEVSCVIDDVLSDFKVVKDYVFEGNTIGVWGFFI